MPQAESKVSKLDTRLAAINEKHAIPHDILQAIVLGYMAMGELETVSAYRVLTRRLRAVGEIELSNTFGAYARHEREHLWYQRLKTSELWTKIPYGLRWIPGRALQFSYMPVGVWKADSDRGRKYGELILDLTDDSGAELTSELTALAHEMYPNISLRSNFMRKKYDEVIRYSKK